MLSFLLHEQVSEIIRSPDFEIRDKDKENDNADVIWNESEQADNAKDDYDNDNRQNVFQPAGLCNHAEDFAESECRTKSIAGKVHQCRNQQQDEQNK